MRCYPPQYPRSSNLLNPSPSLFLFYFPPNPLFSLCFFSFFLTLFFCLIFFLSFLLCSLKPHSVFGLFFLFSTFSTFFLVVVCVYVYLRMNVRAYLTIPCVSANDNVKQINQILRYVIYKKINKMK